MARITEAVLNRLKAIEKRFRNYSQRTVGVELDWISDGERVLIDTVGVLANGFLKYVVRVTLTNRRLVVRSSTPAPWGYGHGVDDKSFEIPIDRLRLVSFRKAELQWFAGGRRGEVIVADTFEGEHKLQLRDAAILVRYIRSLS